MDNPSPKLSVLMTCYNRQELIADSIQSVFTCNFEDFEFIIVDDASTDGTVKVVESFLKKFPDKIRLYVNKENLGDYPNRNRAASLARGEYIKFVDSDDILLPHALREMVDSMDAFPLAAYGLSGVKIKDKEPPFQLYPQQAYEYHYFGPGLFLKGPSSAIFNRQVFIAQGGFSEGRMISDIEMWHKLSFKYPMVVLKDNMVVIRFHPNSELKDKADFLEAGEMLKWKYLLNPQCSLSPYQVKMIRRKRLRRYLGFIFSGFKQLNFRQVKTYTFIFMKVYKLKLRR